LQCGGSGGAVGRFFAPLIKDRLPNRVVKMELGRNGSNGWARIPSILDVEYEGIKGWDSSLSWVENLRHFVSRRLYTCRSTRSVFTDHDFNWSNAGRNAYYADFEWSGP
jgi:hypothetical protein